MKNNIQSLAIILLASMPFGNTGVVPPKELCPNCPKPLHCLNQGWDWAYYENPIFNAGEGYPTFSADAYKTREPLYSDVTPSIGGQVGAGAGTSPVYGSSTELNATYFALNHHAYLYACESGRWQFDITFVDDVVFAWVGDTAYSGWTDENADAKAVWTFQGTNHFGSASFVQELDGGRFYPLRFVFADGQAGGRFELTITSPSGIIVHQSGRDSDWIVRFLCDLATSAPRFPEFGKET
ncbi:GLEYA domain-containing protein [Biscogniauxia marginata]|nr:GLEYA domain-containing protein [Biscogniauxia marginata]